MAPLVSDRAVIFELDEQIISDSQTSVDILHAIILLSIAFFYVIHLHARHTQALLLKYLFLHPLIKFALNDFQNIQSVTQASPKNSI